jgi:hypothetical protein
MSSHLGCKQNATLTSMCITYPTYCAIALCTTCYVQERPHQKLYSIQSVPVPDLKCHGWWTTMVVSWQRPFPWTLLLESNHINLTINHSLSYFTTCYLDECLWIDLVLSFLQFFTMSWHISDSWRQPLLQAWFLQLRSIDATSRLRLDYLLYELCVQKSKTELNLPLAQEVTTMVNHWFVMTVWVSHQSVMDWQDGRTSTRWARILATAKNVLVATPYIR